jgi:hypothetical protein
MEYRKDLEVLRLASPRVLRAWADVVHVANQHFIILDGLNCGVQTSSIVFRDINSVKIYLEAKWDCYARDMYVVGRFDMPNIISATGDPELERLLAEEEEIYQRTRRDENK